LQLGLRSAPEGLSLSRWCAEADPVLRVGEINLLGLHPLLSAEP
jgi:hypothetical protein